MEKESFEDIQIAELLNRDFISIKIDREERPDLDKYYQDLYQMLNRKGGGWPLSVFLSHDKKPFHIDTYIPDRRKYGRVGMFELLPTISYEWATNREDILKSSTRIDVLSRTLSGNEEREVDEKFDEIFLENVSNHFNSKFGGFSPAPKFPQIGVLKTLSLLNSMEMVEKTLKEMVKGGFYDLIDGGFCRYSVDEKWLVPHFEKMAYDNGLLLELFSDFYLKSGNPLFKRIALETASFLMEKMEQENLFYSASDADSEGVEGKYFVYDKSEIPAKVGSEDFEGKAIVRVDDWTEFPEEFQILKDLRKDRVYPDIDKKIITSWNSMIIKGLLKVSKIEKSYLEIAENSMNSLLQKMYIDGILYHSRLLDNSPKIEAFLEDYAYLTDALIELYQETLKSEYLEVLETLVNIAVSKFWRGKRWFTSDRDSDFPVEAETEDSSYPSSRAKIIISLSTSALLLDRLDLQEIAKDSVSRSYKNFTRYPTAFGTFTEAILKSHKELLVIKGKREELEKLEISSPFVFKKVAENSGFDICGIGLCYKNVASSDEVSEFIKGFFI
jgi:uncharacterized protein YyaL (SSP411 family)